MIVLCKLTNILHIKNISNQEELVNLYRSHDLFISPSDAETFGMTTAEAMACGLPVIVNNSAGLPELISEKSGITTDTSVPSSLRAAVDFIKINYNQFTPTEHINSHFSAEIMCKRYVNLYNCLKKNIKNLAV